MAADHHIVTVTLPYAVPSSLSSDSSPALSCCATDMCCFPMELRGLLISSSPAQCCCCLVVCPADRWRKFVTTHGTEGALTATGDIY